MFCDTFAAKFKQGYYNSHKKRRKCLYKNFTGSPVFPTPQQRRPNPGPSASPDSPESPRALRLDSRLLPTRRTPERPRPFYAPTRKSRDARESRPEPRCTSRCYSTPTERDLCLVSWVFFYYFTSQMKQSA